MEQNRPVPYRSSTPPPQTQSPSDVSMLTSTPIVDKSERELGRPRISEIRPPKAKQRLFAQVISHLQQSKPRDKLAVPASPDGKPVPPLAKFSAAPRVAPDQDYGDAVPRSSQEDEGEPEAAVVRKGDRSRSFHAPAGAAAAAAAEGEEENDENEPAYKGRSDQSMRERLMKKDHLYGGKMTHERMTAINAITQEAIGNMHTALSTMPADTVIEETPEGLTTELMQHQKHGLAWMLWREKQQPPCGLLADDMGLGKTLSLISLIVYRKMQRRNNVDDPHHARIIAKAVEGMGTRQLQSNSTLVVAPASLINQWRKEITDRVRPGLLKVEVYHGANRDTDARRMSRNDVVITTYGTMTSELNQFDTAGSIFTKILWERVILDEAHKIKNRRAQTSKCACLIPTIYRWCLTGTPVHNELWDLFSLIRFMRIRPFMEEAHWKQYVMSSNASKSKDRLNTLIKGLLLRRTKVQIDKVTNKPIIELMERHYAVVELKMKGMEMKVYQMMFEASRQRAQDIVNEGDVRRGYKPKVVQNPFIAVGGAAEDNFQAMTQLLTLLLRLRQACVHLSLTRNALDMDAFRANGIEDISVDEVAALEKSVSQMFLTEAPHTVANTQGTNVSVEEVFKPEFKSTKFLALIARLEEVTAKKEKCVIVSQWTKVFELLHTHMRSRGIEFTCISGEVPIPHRQRIVDDFNDPRGKSQVMLLSLTAGGVGLNLVGGNHLFIVDLHWNPAMEQQACDRIYRMGQKKEVFIHKFVVEQTIEARVLQLQDKKTQLATAVLEGAAMSKLNKLSMNDLKFLFDLDHRGRVVDRPAAE